MSKREEIGRYVLIRHGWPWDRWYAVYDSQFGMMCRAVFSGKGSRDRCLAAIEHADRIAR